MEKTIIQTIETSYPYPIASTFRRIRTLDVDDVVNRHDSYGDLFEILTKYIAVISLQDFRTNAKIPEYLDQFLKNMLHPSLGQWNEIIRNISSEDTSASLIANLSGQFYKSKLSVGIKEAAESLQLGLGSRLTIKTYKDVFDLLVLYRNKVWKGHGAKISREEYKERLVLIEQIVGGLLQSINFISTAELFYTDEIQLLPTREFKHKLKLCTGTQIEPTTLVQSNALEPQHLYIKVNGDKGQVIIDLHPLLTFYNCRECKSDQVFVFNDYRKNRLEFLSYACGHFMYPDMLPNEFEKYFQVSLSKVTDEFQSAGPVDEKEVAEKSSELISIALDRIASDQYFEALEYLQLSLSYLSSWEANYYAALTTMLTKGPPMEVLYYINTSVQLEPENMSGQELYTQFRRLYPDDDSVKTVVTEKHEALWKYAKGILHENVYSPEVKPIYYYFTPKIFRSFSYLLWMGLPTILFIVRALISNALGIPYNNVSQILKLCLVLQFILLSYTLANSMRTVYFALMQQVTAKIREKFPSWYRDQLSITFGVFLEKGSIKQRLQLTNQHNRKYLMLAGILLPAAILGAVFLTCFDVTDPRIIMAEFCDYVIMWSIVVPGVPVMVKSFRMLNEYAKLPLRPAVSIVNKVSLNRVGRMILLVSIPWTGCYFCLTVVGYLTFSQNLIFTQLGLFYFMVSLGCVWTLITPLYFSRALLKAKERVLAQYGEHIEGAFKLFMDNPNQEHLDRYKWLSIQQSEVLNITTGALSLSTLIGIIAINLFIIATALMYPFAKYGINLEQIYRWFSETFIK